MDEPVTRDAPTLDPITVLCVVAHPDDVDFGIAGTTTTLTAAGHRVVYCLVTSGQAGGSDPSVSRSDMATLREAEQRAAAEVVGVSELHFLGFPDGAVIASLELRKAIARVIRQVRPDRVITQSPIRILDRMYSSHPDHLATGEATLNAIYPDARNQFAFPELLNDEGLEPHAVPEVWLTASQEPDTYVDITDTIDSKIEALLCHQSQMSEPDKMTIMIRHWAAEIAKAAGFPDGTMAEGFRSIDTG